VPCGVLRPAATPGWPHLRGHQRDPEAHRQRPPAPPLAPRL